MAHDEHNGGMIYGYNGALRILREVDRDIEYPKSDDNWNENNIKYNVSKDLIHKIYGLIKEEMDEYTYEDF